MRELIADLLTFTQLRQGPGGAHESVDLNSVGEKVKLNLHSSIEETGAIVIADPLPSIMGHASHFIPLFQNLIGNAIKYRSDSPPTVQIGFAEAGQKLQFTVADNGIGIPDAYHEGIFVAFKRLHTKKVPGTGIGLAICQRVVERYGGRIWVVSEPGKGSTFHFTLPNTAARFASQK